MGTITPEQRDAIAASGDRPLELRDPETGEAFFLVRARILERLEQQAATDPDDPELVDWANAARRARSGWSKADPN